MLCDLTNIFLGMLNHPPISIDSLQGHFDRLRANDNLKFSQEYEVGLMNKQQ